MIGRNFLSYKKCPFCTANTEEAFRLIVFQLTLADSAGRANTCTGTAGDASVSVDNVLAVSLGNSAYRALALAGTATNTRIRNYICHDNYPP